MTEQKNDTRPSSSARRARMDSPAATLVAFLAVGSAGFLFAHGCGGVSNDRDAAINQATTATCQRYQACNAIGPGLSYATVGDCQADWKNKFTTQWTAQACQNRIDQTNLNICLDGISSTICTSLLDVLNTFYVKCSVNGVCDVPPDAAAKG